MNEKMQKIIPIALGISIVLGVTSIGMSFMALSKVNSTTSTETEVEGEVKNTENYSLAEDIVANIKSEGSISRIANVAVTFEINTDAKDAKDVLAELPLKEVVVRDEIIQTLRECTMEELSSLTAQDQVGEEIKRRVNELMNTTSIVDVYFSKFFIQ